MVHTPIGVMVPVPVMTVNVRPLHRISRIGWLNSEESLDAADDAANGATDDGTDRAGGLSALLNAMRYAARNALRLRREWAGQGRHDRACQYDVKLHATTPLTDV
jgi:hypothetical protein